MPAAPTPRPLAEFARLFAGVPTQSRADSSTLPDPMPVLGVAMLPDLTAAPPLQFITRASRAMLDRFRVQAGDVLISARSTSLRVAVVPPLLAGVLLGATLIAARCGPALQPELLAAFLLHPRGRTQIAALSQSGTAQMNLTVGAAGRVMVPVPARDAQRSLVEFLRTSDLAHQAALRSAELRRSVASELVIDLMLEERKLNG